MPCKNSIKTSLHQSQFGVSCCQEHKHASAALRVARLRLFARKRRNRDSGVTEWRHGICSLFSRPATPATCIWARCTLKVNTHGTDLAPSRDVIRLPLSQPDRASKSPRKRLSLQSILPSLSYFHAKHSHMADQRADTSKMVGWYSPPNLRGTIDIVWGCAFTVFICTWAANHVNVPPYGSSARWRFLYKLKIMMLSLLTPEYTAALAAVDLRTSVILTKHMHKLGFDQWTIKHSFFVIMGAYMIECEKRWTPLDVDTFVKWLERGQLQVGPPPEQKAKTIGTKTRATNTAGKKNSKSSTQEKSRAQSTSIPFSDTIVLPWVSEIGIDDRAKADWLIKAIACIQLGWLIIQLIGRAAQHLSLSSLEATTVSYISCALYAYAVWWNKPYDLQSPVVVSVAADHPIANYLKSRPTYVPFDQEPNLEVDDRTQILYLLGSFLIFGTYSGLHLLAWEVHFGSSIEQQLWRWLTVSLLALHVVVYTAALLVQSRASAVKVKENCIASWQWLAECLLKPITPNAVRPFLRAIHVLDHLDENVLPSWPMRMALMVLTFLYVLTSLYLIVESFLGLRRMPMLLYITVNWLQFLPHIH